MVSSFETKTLGSIGYIITGKTPKTKIVENFDGKTPFITPRDFKGNRYILETERTLSKHGVASVKSSLIPENSVCVTCIGSDMGKTAIARVASVTNQQINSIVVSEDYDYKYIYYNLSARKDEFLSLAGGSAQPILNKSGFSSIKINVPNLSKQKAIAHILGTLDDKIELNRQMNETLEAMAQALFKSWFVDFDPVIDNALLAGNTIPEPLKERAKMRQAQLDSGKANTNSEINELFPSEFEFTEELGWIPSGWSVLRFREVTEVKQGKYLPSKKMQDLQDERYCFPVWGGNGVRGYSEEYIYEDPVVVMTCRGSNCGLLKIADQKSWVTNTSFGCKPKVGSTFFLYQYFSYDDFSSCISGSAQPQITYTALENKIMLFPISEETVQRASEWLQVLRNKQLSALKQNETLTKLRDTLLPKLMSGELRIPDAEKLVADI